MIADCYVNTSVKLLILKGIFVLFLLVGCASQAPVVRPDLDFVAKGKLGVKLGDKGYSASFSWQQFAAGYAIDVWGPLGQGRTKLRGNAASMRVIRGDEVLAEGPPELVMQTHLGWSVPLDVLPAWISGRSDTDSTIEGAVYDPMQRLIEFQQANWHVSFSRFHDAGPDARPGRIVARSGVKKVTVLVRQFTQ